MKRIFHFMLAMLVLGLASCKVMNQPGDKISELTKGKPNIANITTGKYSTTVTANYVLFLPTGYDPRSTNHWPLMMFLHGAGERGKNPWTVTIHGPTKYIEKHPEFPFILLSPQCPDGAKWSDNILMAMLDSICAKYAVDTNRIYLTGLSMGGYGTWSLATMYPERFAAVAPICGGDGNIGVVLTMLDMKKSPYLKKLPIWAFHGAKDMTVSLEESERMVKIMNKIGNKDVKLTIYPEANHNSWTQTYDNPELYQWFLEHKRESELPGIPAREGKDIEGNLKK